MAVFASRQIVVPVRGKMLSDYIEGEIVLLNESGSPVEFYVAKHDYESDLNGSGRTLLVRKDCYDSRVWHSSSNMNAWASCDLRSWLNSNYLNLLDEGIREVIGTTKYYYTPSFSNITVTTRSDAVFQLSLTELGKTHGYANVEGTALPIASTLQVAYINGTSVVQWTRSPSTYYASRALCLYPNGLVDGVGLTGTHGSRPVFTLPSTALFDPDTNQFKGAA